MKRLIYLDVLRGIAILLMVIDHAYDWWVDGPGHQLPMRSVTSFLGTLAASLFLFLVGTSLVLSFLRRRSEGEDSRAISQRIFRRGVLVFVAGYLVNFLVYFTGDNSADIFGFDVLQAIGLSIVLAIPFLFLSSTVNSLLFFPLMYFGQTAFTWESPAWAAQFLGGTAGISYFPLSLWFPFTLAGIVYGQFVGGKKTWKLQFGSVGLGLALLLALPLLGGFSGYRHPHPVFVFFSLTLILLLSAFTWVLVERLRLDGGVVSLLSLFGRTSLMLYIFHLLAGYRLFWLLGWVGGRSWRGEYGVFTPATAGVLFLILVGLMGVIARWWLENRKQFTTAALRSRILRAR